MADFRIVRPASCLLAILLCLWAGPAAAQTVEPADQPQAWLVTYSPGKIYWQRFGHNAIWLRNPANGIDHLFNFGFFDFNQENFLGRFIQGKMLYFAAARSPVEEFGEYRSELRSISIQPLNLSSAQYNRLQIYLTRQVQPDSREYRYDYFINNCSTRLRDALDIALEGELEGQFSEISATLNFRQHVNQLTRPAPWLHLGLAMGLGSPVDQPVSRFAEAFIPQQLAELVADAINPDTGGLLAGPSEVVYTAAEDQPSVAGQAWLRYALWGLLLAGFLLLLSLPAWRSGVRPCWRYTPAVIWSIAAGLAGSLLVYLWIFTDHEAAYRNINLLLLNPMLLPLGLVLAVRASTMLIPVTKWLLAVSWITALLVGFGPWMVQDNRAVIAFCALPVGLAVWTLHNWRPRLPR